MGAQRRFSQFDDLSVEDFARLLAISKLSSEEKEIAAQCIVWHMNYIDVGVIVHMDRRTVSRRMETVILPELERMMRKNIKAGA